MQMIPFTNYRRPHGQQEQVEFAVSDEVAERARKIIDKGLKFESEYLRTGDWSFTITDPEEGDLAMSLVFRSQMGDDPIGVCRAAIEKMVQEFPCE